MKKTILALSLVAALAACNRGTANNSGGAAGNTANESAGLPTPPERPAQLAQQAAMPPGLDCVRNRLSPEERRRAADVVLEQGSREDPRFQTLLEAANACGEELSWSEQKTRLAGQFSMAAAGAAAIREMLGSRGVRVEQLDQTITSDADLMAAAGAGTLGNGTAGREFALRHAAIIERVVGNQMNEEVGTRIGNYIAFRAIAEASAQQFGRAP